MIYEFEVGQLVEYLYDNGNDQWVKGTLFKIDHNDTRMPYEVSMIPIPDGLTHTEFTRRVKRIRSSGDYYWLRPDQMRAAVSYVIEEEEELWITTTMNNSTSF